MLYRTLQSTLRYDTAIRRTCVMTAGSNIASKIAAKPLQMETWLLLRAYKNSSSPYPTVPSPTHYDLRFSHNTCVTDRKTTDRRHIVSKAQPSGLRFQFRHDRAICRNIKPLMYSTLGLFDILFRTEQKEFSINFGLIQIFASVCKLAVEGSKLYLKMHHKHCSVGPYTLYG